MSANTSPSLLDLTPALDPRPLTVTPDTLLIEAIAMMGKAKSSCVLPALNIAPNILLKAQARASCVLVVEDLQLIGILTEGDVVCLIAEGINLAAVTIAEVMTRSVVSLTVSQKSPFTSSTSQRNIFAALSLLRQHQINHLPVLNEQGKLVGIVTPESIRQALQLDELLKLTLLKQVAIAPVIQASASTSVLRLAEIMAQYKAECIVLAPEADENSNSTPVGIVSQQDIVQLQALGLDLSQIQAQSLAIPPLLHLNPDDSVLVALWEMQQQHWQPILLSSTEGEFLGIVTPSSFLQTLDLTIMSQAIEQLQRSIEQFQAEKTQLSSSTPTQVELVLTESPAELLEQLERNRIVTNVALRIRESLNLDDILKTAVNEVRQLLQSDRTIIYRFNPDLSGTVVVESLAQGWQPALGRTITDNCFGKNYAQSYKEGRIQVTEDIYTAGLTQCHIDILALFDIRANLVVPILQGEHLWGLLCACHCSSPRFWREFEVELLKQLATQIAIAIQQSELYHQVQAELTERKRAEEKLKASLKEKEVLLKEIHHRVKNNLQIISSLLKLQSSYIKDEQTLALFKDSQNRIRSMALIHEKLYQSPDLSRINFAEYIHELSGNLIRSYGSSSKAVSLKINVDNILLNIDTAIPCSLIINELVSNALKHAFKDDDKINIIGINVRENPAEKFTLTVSDNGIGLPENFDPNTTESLGLELVYTLAEQLEGSIELDNSNGTSFKISFVEIGKNSRI